MKLGNNFKRYCEDRELKKITDVIYDKTVTITEMHSFLNKDSERKIIFTVKENKENYFYLPDSMEQFISDDDIEAVNKGDYIVGKFTKIPTSSGYEMWIFEDKE